MAHQTFTKAIYCLLLKEISSIATKRGYASALQSCNAVKERTPNVMLKKGFEEEGKVAWMPDPNTGFYRPENAGVIVDPVELRAIHLKNKTSSGQ